MNRDDIGELAAGYALGGLEDRERARFEALLRSGDPDALAALRDYEDALAGLAASAPEPPPPSVKAALMERIAAEGRTAPVRDALPPRRRALWPIIWTGAMAAGLAAVVVGWAVSSTYEKRIDALARQADRLRADLKSQQTVVAILRDPATQVVALRGLEPAPGARARMMWHAQAGGVFVTAGLPAPPQGRTYQLWAITGQKPPVSAGVFGVDPSGTGSLVVPPLPGVARVDAFAVTLEPAGGLAAPSGAMYLLGRS